MSILILNAGQTSPITLTVQSAGESAPTEIGSVSQSFNGSDRSSVRGVKRNYGSMTSYVDTTTKDSIVNLLKWGRQIPCSGDLFGNIQTLCTVRYTAVPMYAGLANGLWTVTLTLSEVNANVTLLRYAPGDTITGESFTRSTTAYQTDVNGVYVSKAINTKRDGHYIVGAGPDTLLEAGRTNSCLRSNDLSNATWSSVGTGAATQNAVGLDGSSNSATTVTDTDAAVFSARSQSITVSNDNAKHCAAFWVKKDSDTTRFPILQISLGGGATPVKGRAALNTSTGASNAAGGSGTNSVRVVDAGLWWIVEVTVKNNTTGNTTLTAQIFPAGQTTFGADIASATGSCVIGQVQVELNSPFYSSPILTTTVAVTRGGDAYSLPFTPPPQEMTAYVKWVEMGTALTESARVFAISDGSGTPEFVVFMSGGFYFVEHINTATVAVSFAVPALGATVELAARLMADGSVQAEYSINGAASVTTSQSAATPLATAWAGQLLWINSAGAAGFTGFIALQSLKVIAGARALSELRAA